MPIVDVLRGKKILLRAPGEVSEVIRCARYIPIFLETASNVSMILSDANGLDELIKTAFPGMSVFSGMSHVPFQYDLELDLTKLPGLFSGDSHKIPVAYLRPSQDTLVRFDSMMEKTEMTNIGLALYGSPDNASVDSATIADNITMSQRHKTQFFFIPADPNQTKVNPPYSNFMDTTQLVRNYGDLAGLLASLDIIICFDNDVAQLATALGKPVWLLIPHSADSGQINSWEAFPNVTIFRQPASGNWGKVIRNIALYRTLQPESIVFTPFSTVEMLLNQPDAHPLPSIIFENTSQLPQILDAELAVFTSVSIETTTVCNLKCPYCPHSTDVAKPPAFMPEDLFFRIIDSLYDYAPEYKGIITPSIYGEPLLDKRIESFIRYAKSRFPDARMELITNGDFLTPEIFFALRDAGVDHYNISQHTPARSQALSDTLTIVEREFNEEMPITIIRMLEQNKFNRGGLVEVDDYPPEVCEQIARCVAAHQNLSFDYKGDAILCCNDYQAKHTYGNIASKSVREIWEGKVYRRVRNMLMLGFLPFPICRVCLNH